jgi:hypothetical protein
LGFGAAAFTPAEMQKGRPGGRPRRSVRGERIGYAANLGESVEIKLNVWRAVIDAPPSILAT